jgi:predicted ATPase
MLRLEGIVDAFNLREITSGWPEPGTEVVGPTITLEWLSEVVLDRAFKNTKPEPANLVKHSGAKWLIDPPASRMLNTKMTLRTAEIKGTTHISSICLTSIEDDYNVTLEINLLSDPWSCTWNGKLAKDISVELNNFIPFLRIDKSDLGPRERQRAYHNAYLVLFEQPLEALRKIFHNLHYLGSSRLPPPSLFKPATADPSDIGISGEFAAQLLQRRRGDVVHFLPPLHLTGNGIQVPNKIRSIPFGEAVNEIMRSLSVETPLSVKDIEQVGFRLMFGNASIGHVGRGLAQLLPLVELGLFADPLRFRGSEQEMSLDEYANQCSGYGHIILEEPEAHLHPKVASRLAHWLVSLAQSNRQVIVETHSDHLVRRLRGLVARAGTGTELERWLLDNVAILSVEQDSNGNSSVATSTLTPSGGVGETWPSDFMDEASDEESAIYYAQLDKSPDSGLSQSVEMIEGEEPVSDHAP